MAFADLGSLGATGSTSNNQTTLVLTTAAAAAVGELVVLVIADDNIGTGADADDNIVSGISDSSAGGPNVWRKLLGWSNNNAGSQNGAAVEMWCALITKAIANGGTITVTFTSNTLSDATALTARHFSLTAGATIGIAGTNTLSNDAADPGSLDAATANIECLRIRGIASEVGNNTNLTNTASWTAWANGNSATTGTTGEMCARAEHIISTGTGSASDPTYVAADCASVYVAIKEIAPIGVTVTQAQSSSAVRKTGKRVTLSHGFDVSGIALASIIKTQTGTGLAQVASAVGNFVAGSGGAVSKVINVTQAQSLTIVRAIKRIISVAQTQAATVFRSTARLLFVQQPQDVYGYAQANVLVSDTTGTGIGQTVAASESFQEAGGAVTEKAVSVVQAQAVSLLRAIARIIIATQQQAVSVLRSIAHSFSVAQSQDISGVAQANIILTNTGTGIGQTVTATEASGTRQKVISLEQIQTLYLTIEAHLFHTMPTVLIGQSVRVVKAAGHRITLSMAQAATVVRSVGKRISVSLAQAVTLTRLAAKTKSITVAQAQSVSRRAAIAKLIQLSQAQSPSIIRKSAKLLSVTQAQAVTRVLSAGKRIVISQGQAASLIRLINRIIAVTQSSLVTVVRNIGHIIRSALAQVASSVGNFAHAPDFSQPVNVLQGQSVTVQTKFWKVISAATASVITVRRAIGHAIAVVTSPVISLVKAVGKIVTRATQGETVSAYRGVGKYASVSQGQSVTLRSQFAKLASVMQGQAIQLRVRVSKIISLATSNAINVVKEIQHIIAARIGQSISVSWSASVRVIEVVVSVATSIGVSVYTLFVKNPRRLIQSFRSGIFDAAPRRPRSDTASRSDNISTARRPRSDD